jgi:hypothetical protein
MQQFAKIGITTWAMEELNGVMLQLFPYPVNVADKALLARISNI